MDLQRRDGWWLWVGGPVPPGASGITFGRLVIVRRGRERNERLLRHELEHVAQYGRHGVVGFLARYVAAYLRWRWRGYGHLGAYRRIPFEASAEWRARRALDLGSRVPASRIRDAGTREPVRSGRVGPGPRDGAAAAASPAAAGAAASPPAASS